MVRAVHEKDWSATPLGPVSDWPPCIRCAVGICLNSDFQLGVLAGPELVYVYNEATAEIFGDKHPAALGRRVADVWPEAWADLGPVLHGVMDTGRAVRLDDWQLILQRRGFSEECYFSVSYSPIFDDAGRAAGVFLATMETSRRFVNERRLRTLNHLAAQVALRRSDDQTLELVRAALADNAFDVPLCALYLGVPGADYANQVFCVGMHEGCSGIDKRIAWSHDAAGAHPLARLAHSFDTQMYDASELLAPLDKCGVWPELPRRIFAFPFTVPGYATPRGFLLVAANPRAPLDEDHKHFIDTIAGLVATAVASDEAIAADRRRIEAIAELDRSKSHFFANASHELRTPVTLIPGPLGELLEQPKDALAPGVRDYIALAHRNAERLHKLVNAIMDFASIEAGQLPLRLEPVDIGALTEEVASLFRSAIEGAGLRLEIRNRLPTGAVANDISERKKAEQVLIGAKIELERRVELRTEQLRQANRLLAAVFDRAPGGIAITDTNGVFVRANPAYQSLVGFGEAELAGRSLGDLTLPEDFAPTDAKLGALLDGEVGSSQIEARTRRADGSVIWVDNFVSMIEDEQRLPRYFVVIAKDITERKRVESERRAAQEELNLLYERLQTVREAERNALAREVHDQLGQTLSAAKIDLKLLEDDIRVQGERMAPEKVIPELHSACATLDRAMQLVRDIATELRAPELDGQGLYAAIDWHARDFERRTRLRTHVELAAGMEQPSRPAAEAVLRIFHEAMTNVLRHAHARHVWISVERRANALLLRVRDDGAGIARQRARNVRSLGITGMQERAALARGRLRVGPLQPRGTLVSALIPMDAPHSASGELA